MPRKHRVGNGEHLWAIVSEYGLPKPTTVWLAPENKALNERRKNEHVLAAGDILIMTDLQPKSIAVATDTRHRFRVSSTPLELRIVLDSALGDPLAGVACRITIENCEVPDSIVSDDDGVVKCQIPAQSRRATIALEEPVDAWDQSIFDLLVGGLDPVNMRSGQAARLTNLGYLMNTEDPPDAELLSAVEEFQCDEELAVDGISGPKTQNQLVKVHGC